MTSYRAIALTGLLLWTAVTIAYGAVPRTHVVGTIYHESGSVPTSCAITVKPSGSFTVNDTTLGAAAKHSIGLVSQTLNVTDASSINIYLVPNTGSGNNPDNTYYSVKIQTNLGTWYETWQVGTSSSDLRVSDVKLTSPAPTATGTVPSSGGTFTGLVTFAGSPGARFIPMSEPSSALVGSIYYDVLESALKYYTGSQWVVIGSGSGGGGSGSGGTVISETLPGVTVANTTSATTVYSYAMPGGTLSTLNKARITLDLTYQAALPAGGTENPTVTIAYGGSTLFSGALDLVTAQGAPKAVIVQAEIMGDGSSSTQYGTGRVCVEGRGDPIDGSFFSTVSSNSTQTFSVTWQWATADASNTVTSRHAVVEWLSPSGGSTGAGGTVVHDSTLDGDGTAWSPLKVLAGGLAHNDLGGLTTGNPHTQYALTTALDSYPTKTTVNTSLTSYLLVDTFNTSMSNYVTPGTLATTLTGYMPSSGGTLTADIDMGGYKLVNSRMDNLATAPTTPTAGQFYLHTGYGLVNWWDGSRWVDPLNRTYHTGSQTCSTISDLASNYLALAGGTVTGPVTMTYQPFNQVVIESLAADPPAGHAGRIFWRSDLGRFRQDDGAAITDLAVGGGAVETLSPVAGNGLSGNPIRLTTGSVDHGQLAGLADDDHPQYVLVATLPTTLSSYCLHSTVNTSLDSYLPTVTANASFSLITTVNTSFAGVPTNDTVNTSLSLYLPTAGGTMSGDLVFNHQQAKSMRLENLAANPSAGHAGRIFWNTALAKVQLDNGVSVGDLNASSVVNWLLNGALVASTSYLDFHGCDVTLSGTTLHVTPSAHGASLHTGAIGTLSQVSDVTMDVAVLNALPDSINASITTHNNITTAHSATATPTADRIVMSDGSGKLAAGWIPDLTDTYMTWDTVNTSLSAYTPTTRQITAGSYLSGGGDFSADRAFALLIGDVSRDVTPTFGNIQGTTTADATFQSLATTGNVTTTGFSTKDSGGTVVDTKNATTTQTSDATCVSRALLTLASNSTHALVIYVAARATAGTSADKSGFWRFEVAASNTGGTLTFVSDPIKTIVANDLGGSADCGIKVSGLDVTMDVTGTESTTVKWSTTIQDMSIAN